MKPTAMIEVISVVNVYSNALLSLLLTWHYIFLTLFGLLNFNVIHFEFGLIMAYLFKFAGNTDAVDESLQNDIAALNNIDLDKCAILISSSLSYASKLNIMSMDEVVNELSSDIATKLELKSKSLKRVLISLLLFVSGAIKYNLSVSSVEADLNEFGLDSEHISVFTKSWNVEYVKLNRSAVKSSLSLNEVVDMEWKFGVSASSDNVKKLGTTFLQLKLLIDKGNNKTENVVMGMLQL